MEQNDSGGEASTTTIELLHEMEEPWPATFERSISLLASPVMTPKTADFVTKSPKAGNTPLFGGPGLRGLRRGYDTPDHPRGRKLLRPQKSFDAAEFQNMPKIKSADFKTAFELGMQISQEKGQRAAEARRKVLAEQEKKSLQSGTKSPGYDRELQFARRKKAVAESPSSEKASFAQCVFNMSNILMGVGMLGLPFVFKSSGWMGGFFVTCFFCFITWKTSKMIGRQLNGDPRPTSFFDDSPYKSPVVPGSAPGARMRRPITSFPQIAREAFGQRGNILLSSILYFELFSCLCIFLVTIGDHLNTLLPDVPKELLMAITAGALTIPTALLRTPKLLSYLSMVGTFATISVVLSVLAAAIIEGDISEQVLEKEGTDDGEPLHILWRTAGLPVALGLIAYTFSGHAIVPSIYSSMERPQDFERMIDATYLVVMGACLIVAVSGYYMFGSSVEDQVTISLEENSSAVMAMKGLTCLMILTAFSKFTLTMFPLALGIEEIVAPYVCNDAIMSVTDSIIKMSLIVVALVVALFVPSFSYICALVGMICTLSVSVIFPAAAHLSLFGPRLSLGEQIFDWTIVIIGAIVAVIGTIATV